MLWLTETGIGQCNSSPNTLGLASANAWRISIRAGERLRCAPACLHSLASRIRSWLVNYYLHLANHLGCIDPKLNTHPENLDGFHVCALERRRNHAKLFP